MPKDSYTLLILPKKHSSAKKICLPSGLVKGASVFLMVVLMGLMFSAFYRAVQAGHGLFGAPE